MLLIVIGLLLGLEYGAKAYYISLPEPPPRNMSKLAYAYHPQYNITMRPNTEKVFQRTALNGGQKIVWKTNRYGHRGETPVDTSSFKIMVFGDSNIQGRFSEKDSTFCQQLQRQLQSKNLINPVVINTGIVGLGPDQVLIKMKQELPVHRPEVVLLQLFADNDFGDLIRNRLFELNEMGELMATDYPITLDQLIHPLPPKQEAPSYLFRLLMDVRARYFPTATAEKDTTLDALEERYLDWCKKEMGTYKKGLPRTFSHFADHYDLDMALFPASEEAQLKIKLMTAILLEIKKTVEQYHAQLLVVILPSSLDLTTNFKLNKETFSKHAAYQPGRLSHLMDSLCAQHHIPAVNLFHPFAKANPNTLYFHNPDNHWNDKGQHLAAEITAQQLSVLLKKH
jgi:hypothetical protein